MVGCTPKGLKREAEVEVLHRMGKPAMILEEQMHGCRLDALGPEDSR